MSPTSSTAYTTSYTSYHSSRNHKPKRSDSLETIRPTSPGPSQSKPSGPKSPRPKFSQSKSSSHSSSKSKSKHTEPLNIRRYSAEGLWKAAPKLTSTDGSKASFATGISRSPSPTSSSCSSTSSSSSSSGSESRGRKGHRRSYAAYGLGLGLPSGRRTQSDDSSRDLTPRAPVKGIQKSASCSELTGGNGPGCQPTTSVSTVNVQATLVEPQQKGNTVENPQATPRPPLRVINDTRSTSPESEDEFVDMEVNPNDDTVPIHIEDTRHRASSPGTGSEYSSDDINSDNDYFEVLPPKWGKRIGNTRKPSEEPDVSLRINLRDEHTISWDVKDGGDLLVKGCLELTDRLHETRYHHAEIHIRSYVGANILATEHFEDPEFVLHYKETHDTDANNPFKTSKQVENEKNGNADKDKNRPRITTHIWKDTVGCKVPMWAKYFTAPIPAKLFDSRESRLFRIEARVGYYSAYSARVYREVAAPIVHTSVTHLNSARELGIRRQTHSQGTSSGNPKFLI